MAVLRKFVCGKCGFSSFGSGEIAQCSLCGSTELTEEAVCGKFSPKPEKETTDDVVEP